MEFDIQPIKTDNTMSWFTKQQVNSFSSGGWFNKITLTIGIFGNHLDIFEYIDTVNHECLHQIVQIFLGGEEHGIGWISSTGLDLDSLRDFMSIM